MSLEIQTPPNLEILTELLGNNYMKLLQNGNLTIKLIEKQKEVILSKCQSLENENRELQRSLECNKKEGESSIKFFSDNLWGVGTHQKVQTSFKEDNRNRPYVHNAIRYIFNWLKLKLVGFNEYSEVHGTICHALMSKGLGLSYHVSR